MGYYIEVENPLNKAEQIINKYKAVEIPQPRSFKEVGDKALICVVQNGMFDAAGFCYDEREFRDFSFNDGRPKRWLLMDRKEAETLTGFKK